MKKGFSILELTIAIFLIAAVLGTVLLLMAANARVISHANELMISSALVQYQVDIVKNIDFPPVYFNNQDGFGYETPDENPVPGACTDANFTPPGYEKEYRVERYVNGYKADGSIITNFDSTQYDTAMLLKIRIFVLRKKDNTVLMKIVSFITRNTFY